jgi:hypothetical protein
VSEEIGKLNHTCLRSSVSQAWQDFQENESFSPFSARDGLQVHRPSWIWATSLRYILLNKFVAHLVTKKD